MALRVIGAGLGRTGTTSLKIALELLFDAPCYHMSELLHHREHAKFWLQASRGEMRDWDELFAGYCAAVDAPTACFWQELMEAYPEALVILSVRDAQSWWKSASKTILKGNITDRIRKLDNESAITDEWNAMERAVPTFHQGIPSDDREAIIEAYEKHNAHVKASVPADRLLVWQVGEGWGPLCARLNLPIPDTPFPHTNTRTDWYLRKIKKLLPFMR